MEDQRKTIDVLRRANDLLAQDEFERALELIDNLDKTNEQNGLISFVRGNVYLRADDPGQAYRYYVESLNNGFLHTQLFINLGIVVARLGDMPQSEMMYRQAADLDPTNPEPFNRIIQQRLEAGNTEGALKAAEELMERNPELIDGFHHKADYLMGTGRTQEALEMLQGVEQIFSSNPLYLYDCSRAIGRLGHPQEALKLLEEYESTFRNEFYRQMYNKQRAILLVQLDRASEAEPLWAGLFEKYGDRRAGLSLIAAAFAREDMEEIIHISQEMIDADTGDEAHYLCLYYKALALQQLKSDEEQEAWQKANEAYDLLDDETALPILSLRATLRTQIGRYDDALTDIDRAETKLRQENASPDAENALETLAQMRADIQNRQSSFA